MKHVFFILICYFLIYTESSAIPQFTLLTGNKCQSCHVSPQGGNIRSELGWYSQKDVSLIPPESIGLGGLFALSGETNSFFEGLLTYGFDYRLQTAKLGGPVVSKREYFHMQISPYVVLSPFEWLKIGGHYNIIKPEYRGQKQWSAYAIYQPDPVYPYIRAGFIQPSIGTKFDDHTVFIRQVAGASRANPVVPPDYMEYGAEVGYEGIKWLSLTGGVYSSRSMSEITVRSASLAEQPVVDKDGFSTLLRVAFLPRFMDDFLNTNVGASYFLNDDYSIIDVFAQAGLTDYVSLITEYMHSDKKDIRVTDNLLAMVTYRITDGLLLEARYERGMTNDKVIDRRYNTNQYVFGAQLFPLPFIEIRPEYRIYDREYVPHYSSQWAAQLHIFY